jgi:hypothetical protein
MEQYLQPVYMDIDYDMGHASAHCVLLWCSGGAAVSVGGEGGLAGGQGIGPTTTQPYVCVYTILCISIYTDTGLGVDVGLSSIECVPTYGCRRSE